MNDYPLTLFFDGGCSICRFDIANSQRAHQEGLLRFVDITEPGFDPAVHGRTAGGFPRRMACAKGERRISSPAWKCFALPPAPWARRDRPRRAAAVG